MRRVLRLFIILLTVFTVSVYAEETNCLGQEGTNCTVTIGTVEKKSTDERFYADSDVIVDEDISKTAFFAGNNVNVESKIDGIAFIAGNSIIASTESDYAFIAGNSINLKNFHAKDAFIAGNQISIENATGTRSIYATGSSININTDYVEDLYLAGKVINLKGKFENVVVDAEKIIISGEITGKLKVNEKTEVVLATSSTIINETEKYTDKDIKKELKTNNVFSSLMFTKVLSFLTGFANLLFIGVILIAIFNKRFEELANIKNSAGYIFGRIGLGLCGLILAPILIIVLLITGFASLLGVLAIFLYITAIIVSTPVVAINYSNILLKSIKNEYFRYIVALMVLQLIKSLPVIGGLVTFLTLCLGMGLLKDMFLTEKKEK